MGSDIGLPGLAGSKLWPSIGVDNSHSYFGRHIRSDPVLHSELSRGVVL